MNKRNLLSQYNFVHITLFAGVLILFILLFLVKTFVSYPFIIFISSLFCISVLAIVILIQFNKRQTKPLTELTDTLRTNSKIPLDSSKTDNEIDLVVRYITLLEKQIDFYEKKFENITSKSKSFENDLKLANRLQKNLFPANTPHLSEQKKFEIYAYSESAFEVGGDLYDCFLIDDDHLLVAVADVAGKGIAASLYMIYTHTLLRSFVKPTSGVTDIVQQLNNQLIEENISDMFVTLFLGILNLSNGIFEYCNAAHNLPCIIRATGNVFELPETHGIPIGIYPNRIYLSSTITLNSGDQLFMYTDGLTDTIDENGIKYSLDVLKYNLMGTWFNNATEVTERIKTSIEYFRGTNNPTDDMTILTLKYTPENQVSSKNPSSNEK